MGICQSGRAIAVAFDQLLALPLAAFNSRAMKWNKISTEREREREEQSLITSLWSVTYYIPYPHPYPYSMCAICQYLHAVQRVFSNSDCESGKKLTFYYALPFCQNVIKLHFIMV